MNRRGRPPKVRNEQAPMPPADNPFVDEDEQPERVGTAEGPKPFPQVFRRDRDLERFGEPRDPHGPEAQQSARQERARRAYMKRRENNPFIADGVQVPMPKVPVDDPEWSYKFVRDMLPPDTTNAAGADTSNIANHLHGRLRYEFVTLDMLSPEWQGYYAGLAQQRPGLEGAHGRTIRYRDVILMRCSREMRDMQFEAWDYEADRLRGAVTRGMEHAAHMHGGNVRFQDDEREGYVDIGR